MTTTLAAAPGRARTQRMLAPAAVIGGLGLATLALHARDPHVEGSWGFCPSAALGIWCPGCGGLRAVNDLSNGDVVAAAASNLLFVVLVPFIVLGLAVWAVDRWRGTQRAYRPRGVHAALAVLGVAAVGFTVLRNLAVGSWLAP